jgi:hypothetical protein
MPGLISVETTPGQAVMAHGRRLIPFATKWTFYLPVFNLGLVWNRPVSVLVTGADGSEQVLPVRDPTRQIVWALWGASAVLAIWLTLTKITNRGKQ